MCVWILCAVGDYIHPAPGSPRGERGNVIYTLVMSAPLNTPPDRCNILDISSSFFTPSFPSFRLNPIYTPSPMLIFALLIMNTEQLRCRGAAVVCVCEHFHVCVQNGQNRSASLALSMSLSLSLLLSPQSVPIKMHPLPITPLYKSVSRGWGDQPCSTVPPPMGN